MTVKVCIQTVKPRARHYVVRRNGAVIASWWNVWCPIASGTHPNLDEAIVCWRANRLHTQRVHPRHCK